MLGPVIVVLAVLTVIPDGSPQPALLQVEIKALAIALLAVAFVMALEIFS